MKNKNKTRHRRSKLEMYCDILKFCNIMGGQHHNRNQINSKLLISFAQINEYIIKLHETGLLEINRDDRTVITSLKGVEFIKKFDSLTQQFKIF
jgi:predicted transcriptional regulator